MTEKWPETTEEVLDLAGKYVFYTWCKQKNIDHIAVKKTEGCYFWDYEGNKYLDAASQLVNLNLGFQHPKVVEAIKAQADKMCYIAPSYATDVRGVLGKKIIEEIAPKNMGKVMFTLGGADANEYAIRIANVFTGKYKIFTQYMSYHGSTYGAANLNGQVARGTVDPGIAGFIHFFGPNWREHGLEFKDEDEYSAWLLRMLERQIIQEGPDKIAAILMESMQGGGGAVALPVPFAKGVRALCDKYNILMICDEVMVGFGRTGKWFAFENYGIEPDIITFAKGSTCGYTPFGGVIVSKKIAEYFDDVDFPAGLTYNAHPICCATALATLEVYQEEKLIENSAKMGEILLAGLKELCEKHKCIANPRGMGLMTGVDFVGGAATPAAYAKMKAKYMELGVLTYILPGRNIIAPPLIINEEQIKTILEASDEVFTFGDTLV